MTVRKDTLLKCPSCHGIWFEGGELSDAGELPYSELMQAFQDQLDAASAQPAPGAANELPCPRCQKPLDRHQYDVSSGIVVDSCLDGHGVWLDRGEVIAIHRYLEESAKDLPPEKLAELNAQLAKIRLDEDRKLEEAVLSPFHHEGTGAMAPAWHAMDGVCRFLWHVMYKIGL